MSEQATSLAEAFRSRFSSEPHLIAHAPGRVGIIGGHIDFNHGCVIGAAIDRSVLVAAALSDQYEAYGANFDQVDDTPWSEEVPRHLEYTWANYVRGVIDEFQKLHGPISPVRLMIEGHVPMGGGLSSSAALEMAVCTALLHLMGKTMTCPEMAALGQRVENDYVGVKTGIMDQFISATGKEGKAVFIDCRTLDYEHVCLPKDTSIVVFDSKRPRYLSSSDYNTRRGQCEAAVQELKVYYPEITHLRDVSVEQFEAVERKISEIPRMRARHVITEIARVVRCRKALADDDAGLFGQLLNQSHASSRDFYQSSVDELNWLQEAASSHPSCLGSRLTGAGFGGCTVAITEDSGTDDVIESVIRQFTARAGNAPEVFRLKSSNGAGIIG